MTLSLNDQLDLATEFRIPCTNTNGGYAEVAVERSHASGLWAVSDGAFTRRRVWHDGSWQYLSDVGRSAAYRHTREEALELGQRVAELEGADIDKRFAEIRAAQEAVK